METMTTNIRVVYTEDGHLTHATATVTVGARKLTGSGRARRNPHDPQMPEVGEELALARALADLSDQLLRGASKDIEAREGHRVFLRR